MLDRIRATRACTQSLSSSLMRARWWIEMMGRNLTLFGLVFQLPHITATPDDEIAFEWWNGERKLTMYASGASIDFVQSWGPDIEGDMNDGVVTSGLHATILWRWLTTRGR